MQATPLQNLQAVSLPLPWISGIEGGLFGKRDTGLLPPVADVVPHYDHCRSRRPLRGPAALTFSPRGAGKSISAAIDRVPQFRGIARAFDFAGELPESLDDLFALF